MWLYAGETIFPSRLRPQNLYPGVQQHCFAIVEAMGSMVARRTKGKGAKGKGGYGFNVGLIVIG